MACRALWIEKKRVSPQKKMPAVTDSSGRFRSSGGLKVPPPKSAAVLDGSACRCGVSATEGAAVHHGTSSVFWFDGDSTGAASLKTGSSTGSWTTSGCGKGVCESVGSGSSGDVGIWVSTVWISKSEVNGLFKNPITFGFELCSGRRSATIPDI